MRNDLLEELILVVVLATPIYTELTHFALLLLTQVSSEVTRVRLLLTRVDSDVTHVAISLTRFGFEVTHLGFLPNPVSSEGHPPPPAFDLVDSGPKVLFGGMMVWIYAM